MSVSCAPRRTQFALPPERCRLAVEIGGRRDALWPECCDVLVVDAYHDEEHVQELATAQFYDARLPRLAEPGALVGELHGRRPRSSINTCGASSALSAARCWR